MSARPKAVVPNPPQLRPLSEDLSIDIRGLCRLLGRDQSTVYRWMQRGDSPPSYKIGGRRLWRQQDVLQWIEGCREGGAA